MSIGAWALPAQSTVVFDNYRGKQNVPGVLRAPNYANYPPSTTAAIRIQNLSDFVAGGAGNIASSGVRGDINWISSDSGLCNSNVSTGDVNSPMCQQQIQGKAIYALVKFDAPGAYGFKMLHDDEVKVAFSTAYDAQNATNYRNFNYNVPVGGVLEGYTSTGDDLSGSTVLPGTFQVPASNMCYAMRILWNNNGGLSVLRMQWVKPDGTTEIIPAANLLDPGQSASYDQCTSVDTDLAIHKSVSAPVFTPGSNFTYSVTVWNKGPNSASDFTFADTLPAGVTAVGSWTCNAYNVDGSANAAPGVSMTSNGNAHVVRMTGVLAVNDSAAVPPTTGARLTCALTVSPDSSNNAPNALTNTATITVHDRDASNNSSSVTSVKAGAFTVAKTGPATAIVGADFNYMLTVTNNTGLSRDGAQIWDQLPSGVMVTSASVSSGTVSCAPLNTAGALLKCTLNTGAPNFVSNSSRVITLTAKGTTPSTVTNYAATHPSGSGSPTTNPGPFCDSLTTSCSSATTQINAADARVVKQFSPAVVTEGAVSQLTITVDNTASGSVALTGASLTDSLPAGMTVAANPDAANTCGGTVTAPAGATSVSLANGSVAAGGSCSVRVNVQAGVGSHVNDIAVKALSTMQGVSNSQPTSATLVVNAPAALNVVKTLASVNAGAVPAGYVAQPGDVLTYALSVANTGGTAGSTTLTETVPAGTQYVGTSEGWTATCTNAGSSCTQSVNVAAGANAQVYFSVAVSKPGAAGTIVNTAQSSQGSCTTCTVNTTAAQADMQVTAAAGVMGTVGTELTLVHTCKNNGPQAAVNASCSSNGPTGSQTICSPSGNVASLAVGDSIVCTTKFTTSAAGTYTLTTVAGNDLYDALPGNNSGSTPVTVTTPAALSVAKTLVAVNAAAVPTGYVAHIGDKLTYAIAVSNSGGVPGTSVLTETVPQGTKYVGDGTTAGGGEGWTAANAQTPCAAAGAQCVQSVSVAAQSGATQTVETRHFTVEVIAPAQAQIINTITSDTANACTGTSCTVTVNSAEADMQAQITSMPTNVTVGTSWSMNAQCTNNGPATAVNARCTLVVSTSTGQTLQGSCDAPATLVVGGALSCTLALTPTQAMTLVATVTAATDSHENNLQNNVQTQSAVVNTPETLSVVKSLAQVNDAPPPAGYSVRPGDKLTYQLRVSNTGGTTGSTTLTETVPAGTQYVGTSEGWAAGCAAAGTACNQSVQVTAGTAQAPGTATVFFTVKVDGQGPAGSIVNTVSSSATGSCDTACTVSTAVQQADVQATSSPGQSVKVGDVVTITSTCLNAGPFDTTSARCEVSGAPAEATTTCTPSGSVATLAVGQSIVCTTRFTAQVKGSFTVTTTAHHNLFDPNRANNIALSAVSVTAGNINPPQAATPVPVNARWTLLLMSALLVAMVGVFMRRTRPAQQAQHTRR